MFLKCVRNEKGMKKKVGKKKFKKKRKRRLGLNIQGH